MDRPNHQTNSKVGAVVVVKWSACSPSTPTIRVRISLKPTVFPVKFVFEKKENKQKDAGVGPLKTITRKFSKFWYFIPTYEPNSFFDWPHPNCLLQKNSMVEKFSSWLFIPFYFYKKPRAHSYTEYFKRHFTLC